MTFDDFSIEDGTQRLGIGPVAITEAGWWHVRLGIHRAKREVRGMEYTPEANDLTEPSGVARFLAASLAAAEMVLVLLLLGYSVWEKTREKDTLRSDFSFLAYDLIYYGVEGRYPS